MDGTAADSDMIENSTSLPGGAITQAFTLTRQGSWQNIPSGAAEGLSQ